MVAVPTRYGRGMTGRFAPSPTSQLHLGNLRTALLAWLFARSRGEDFLLRVEDLDQQRVAAAKGVAEQQLADLAELGVDWDPPVVSQSDRLDLYRDAALGLETYPCFCSRAEIAAASQAPHGAPRAYPGTCATLTADEIAERSRTRRPAIRVRAHGEHMTVHDLHAGEVNGEVDDFVLFRADGTPAYNLAVVVDDGLQGVTQVCRGDDLLSSSPRQAWLANRLGFDVPEYIHVSLAVNADGVRLAKRDKAVTLGELHEAGVSTAQVMHALCSSAGLPVMDSPAEVLDSLPADWWTTPELWQPWVVTDQLVWT